MRPAMNSKAAEYRGYAEGCMHMADRMRPDARLQLIEMAAAWLELARAELTTASQAEKQELPQ